ncbi:tetratricopeptide repeat protein [Azospirillum sp. ST 5-10]|uniref:tetratricopeptide repeat protein n=1 Tax=unclassified Azospirillum TaxID=2630922 RepID=UPI003F49EB4B
MSGEGAYFHLRENPDSDDLLVLFCGANTEAGRFDGFQALEGIAFSVAFVNCPDNGYYVSEVPGVGREWRESAAFFRELAARHRRRGGRVVSYGNSMGAYAAVLFGCLMGADLNVGLATETLLNIADGALMRTRESRPVDGPALVEVLADAPTPTVLWAGEKFLADMMCGAAVRRRPHTVFVGVRNAFHSMAPYVHARFGLRPFLESVIADRRFGVGAAFSGTLIDHPALIEALYGASIAPGPAEALDLLGGAATDGLAGAPLGYHRLAMAKALLACGQAGEAEVHARTAWRHNPGDVEAAVVLARALVALGRETGARAVCERMHASHDPHLATQVAYRRLLDEAAALRDGGEPVTAS